jgi:hypothetical protein
VVPDRYSRPGDPTPRELHDTMEAAPTCNFWFAEYDDTQQTGTCKWTPVMEGDGATIGVQIWFETQQACEEFIRDEIIGAVGHYEAIRPVSELGAPTPE